MFQSRNETFSNLFFSKWSFNIQSISARNLSYGYSPFWDDITQSLYFVDFDIVDQCLFRYDFRQKTLYAAGIEGGFTNPSFIIPLKNCPSQFAVSIERTVMIIQWDGVSSMARFVRNVTAVEQNPIYDGNHFDRAKVDPKGRLYAGTYRTDYCPSQSASANGSLYLFEKNHNIQTLIANTKSATGLSFDKKKNFFTSLIIAITFYQNTIGILTLDTLVCFFR